MARRRKTSTLDDLLNIAMKMPLWANLVIAGGSFAFLRYYGCLLYTSDAADE